MKRLTIIVAALLIFGISTGSFAQQTQQTVVPHAIKYQAVVRNSNGDIISNQNVSFRISIVEGNASGITVYQESQTATTNQFGLANLSIGKGNVLSGNFNDVQWGNDSYFVKVEFDPKGGSDYVLMGTSEMLSVPYALYAEKSSSIDNFPVKTALQATDIAAPLTNPQTGMLVYNTATTGVAPHNVAPGYYYNAGSPQQPNWVQLSSNDNSGSVRRILSGAAGTNTTYGGSVQDNSYNPASQVGNCGTGSRNTAFGDTAMNNSMSGNDNSGLGYQVLQSLTTGLANTAVGSQSMLKNTTAYYNTAEGYQALNSNTILSQNVAVGYQAMYTQSYNTTAANSYNCAVGVQALYSNQPTTTTNGYENTALGNYSLYNNTTGSHNCGAGIVSLYTNTTGGQNTAVGNYNLDLNTIGSYNSSLGDSAMYKNTTGDSNTAVGYDALITNTTGYDNTALGYAADVTANNLHNATAIGSGAKVNASNKIVIGNANATTVGGYGLWTNYSDRRLKENIVYTNALGLNFITRLNTASYNYIADKYKKRRDGLIAQDVQKVLNDLGLQYSGLIIDDDSMKTMNLSYDGLVIPLINSVKELNSKNEALSDENALLKKELSQQKSAQIQLKDVQANDERGVAELRNTVNSLLKAQASIK